MQETKHTPTPFSELLRSLEELSDKYENRYAIAENAYIQGVVDCVEYLGNNDSAKKAVNSHHSLVGAIKEVVDLIEEPEGISNVDWILKRLKEALKEAGE